MPLSCHCPEEGHRVDCHHYAPPREHEPLKPKGASIVMDTHPLKDIEDKSAMKDFGRSLVHMWRGIVEEADSEEEAWAVMRAWIKGMKEEDDKED